MDQFATHSLTDYAGFSGLSEWLLNCRLASHVEPNKQPKMAKEVLDHFYRNPQAVDTLEGVARWRLLRETVHRRVEETAEALEWLVTEGLLKKTSTTYSKPIYSLNPAGTNKAERLLGRNRDPKKKD